MNDWSGCGGFSILLLKIVNMMMMMTLPRCPLTAICFLLFELEFWDENCLMKKSPFYYFERGKIRKNCKKEKLREG